MPHLIRRRQFLALTGAALTTPAWARANMGPSWQRDFNAFVADRLTNTNTPGLAAAMVAGGQTVFAQGYGYADVETARRVTADSIFQIASVSKTVTATALMMLWQDGAFRLDDPIAPHLDFAVVNPKFPDVPITFRQLFTHTSSISDDVYYTLDFSAGALPPLRDFLANYLAPPKAYAETRPGAVWSYSNVAVALLGYLGERLSGKSLDVFTRERIFAPLNMAHTSWRYEGVPENTLAEPYDFENAHFKRLPRARYPDWPAGLLCTSANDFAKFLVSYRDAALLEPATIRLMFAPDPVVMNPKSPNLRQGLIWELAPLKGDSVAMHLGGDPGAATIAAIDITRRTAALAFANITPDKDKVPFLKETLQRLLQKAATV